MSTPFRSFKESGGCEFIGRLGRSEKKARQIRIPNKPIEFPAGQPKEEKKVSPVRISSEFKETANGRSTKALIKEKDKMILNYAKDSGLDLKQVNKAIRGYKKLNLSYANCGTIPGLVRRYNDTPRILTC